MPAWNRTILDLGLIAVLAGVTVWVAPVERTMGEGIRAVYVHVALTIAGVVGFAVEALLGIGALVTGSRAIARWLLPVAGVALGLFAAGTIVSAAAAWINWGGMFLDEPVLRSSVVGLAAGFLLYAVMNGTRHERIQGILGIAPAVTIAWVFHGTPVLLHPGSSVLPESAGAIQGTFVALTVLCVAAGARLAWQFGRRLPEGAGTS